MVVMTSPEIDRRIIESIRQFHRDGKPIYVYRLGMDCGLDPSIVSRWFRDRGIFWDHWRREWVAIIPELAGPVLERLPVGAISQADWLSSGWLRRGYMPRGRA